MVFAATAAASIGGSVFWLVTGAAGAEPSLWLYKDPSGKEQGPYPPSQLLDWSEQGYFPISLQALPPLCV